MFKNGFISLIFHSMWYCYLDENDELKVNLDTLTTENRTLKKGIKEFSKMTQFFFQVILFFQI